MPILTPTERAFIAKHGFALGDIYDGRGEGKGWREYQAKQAGKALILTSVPCKAKGHRIRTQAGHCAQCKFANIGFAARESNSNPHAGGLSKT